MLLSQKYLSESGLLWLSTKPHSAGGSQVVQPDVLRYSIEVAA